MAAYAIMRQEKIKTTSNASARLRHNRREVPCKTADQNKRNISLICNDQSRENAKKSFSEIFKDKVGKQKIRSNAVKAIEVVMTFSPGAVSQENLKPWMQASMRWLCDLFGKDNVIDSKLHLDETTPHIHSMIIPIDDKGKLNARAFLGGTRDRMVELQTSYAEAVKSFGLERGIPKQITGATHQNSQRWIAENEQKEVRLCSYEAVFGTEKEWDFETYNKFVTTRHDFLTGEENKPSEASKVFDDRETQR